MKTLLLTLVLFNFSALAGGMDIGSGGDLIKCQPSSKNNLFGLYSLDYLVHRSNFRKEPQKATSWKESLFNIRVSISQKVPELLSSFDLFSEEVLNTDYSRLHVWEPTDYALIEIEDENLPIAVDIPENCRQDGNIQLIQAVIRQHRKFSGGKNIVFKYIPETFSSLEQESPLQLSFLLVHEWLWSISDNVDRNRRVNWYLHSEEFNEDRSEDARATLRSMGLDINAAPIVVAQDGTGDYVTLQQALLVSPTGAKIHLKPGRYSTAGTPILKSITIKGIGDPNDIWIEGIGDQMALEVDAKPDETIRVENVTFFRRFNRENRWRPTLFVSSGSLHLTGCRIPGDEEGLDASATTLHLKGSNSNAVLTKNYFGTASDRIFIEDQATLQLYENTFHPNHSWNNDYPEGFGMIMQFGGKVAPRDQFVFEEDEVFYIDFDSFNHETNENGFCTKDEVFERLREGDDKSDVRICKIQPYTNGT